MGCFSIIVPLCFAQKSGRFSNFSMGYRRGSVENPQTWARTNCLIYAPFTLMFGSVTCLIAIGCIGVTRTLRGRFAALILTVILAAIVALADPPFLSFRVERNTDF